MVLALADDMTRTSTVTSLTNQPQATGRVSFNERPTRPLREQQTASPPRLLDRPITQARPTPLISTLLRQIQSEYREMPGLKLTEPQARRLWDLDADTCNLVLTTLLEQQFLKCTANGTYVRAAD